MPGRIGVALTSRNRRDTFNKSYAEWKRFLPDDAVLVVVDDASDVPIPEATYRFNENVGIARGKNKSLELLMAAGCQSLYLADDDVFPTSADWWEPYVLGPEPAYTYCWTHFAKDHRAVPKMDVLYRDDDLVGYGSSMGCLQYVERHVIDRVGGMRLEFGLGFEEHLEFFARIHAAGLTSFANQDQPAMTGRIWAGDEHYAVKRSFDPADRNKLLARNTKLRESLVGSTDFVEYRQQRDIVLTSFFTGQPDPQRGRKLAPDPDILKPLEASCTGHELIVLHDCFDRPDKVDAPWCAYQQRWLSQFQYLRQHPEIRWVAMVDATDTRLLNDPFPHLKPDTLYVGYENQTVGCPWIRQHCPPELKPWVDANRDKTLVNTGVVIGDRATAMHVCQAMTDAWLATDRRDPLVEMAIFQKVCYDHPNMITGKQVTTEFKTYTQSDPISWIAHK